MTRRSATREAIARVLDEAGLRWRHAQGGRHPCFVVEVGGTTRRIIIPSSPSDGRALLNSVCCARRLLRQWQAAA